MAMQGVSSYLLELTASNDKNASAFLASLKPGDTIKGRVAEILGGQNKAVINFRGNNLISQLPENTQLAKGETLTFTVTNVNEKIFMKIINDPAMAIARGMDPQQAAGKAGPAQFADILTALKVPVNEQNLFIASRLSDYHIPVNKENMTQMSVALNNFMESKGIDMRAFGADSLSGVKETLVMNLFRLMNEAASVKAQNLPPSATLPVSSKIQPAITAAADYAAIGKSAAAVLPAGKESSSGIEKFSNILSVINSLSKSINDGSVAGEAARFSVSFKGAEMQYLATALRNASAEGYINPAYSAKASDAAAGKSQLSILSGNAWAEIAPDKGGVTITLNNLPNAAADSVKSFLTVPQMRHEANALISRAAAGTIIELPAVQAAVGSVPSAQQQTTALITALKAEITAPQNTTPQQNAAAIINSANMLKQEIGFNRAGKSGKESNGSTTDIKNTPLSASSIPTKAESVINKFLSQASVIAANEGQESINPAKLSSQGIMQIREAARDMAAALDKLSIMPKNLGVFTPPSINTPFDPDTSIEALALLKSRQIDINNPVFVETMAKYFKSDMKLAANIETLSAAINAFQSHKVPASEAGQVKSIQNAAADLKNVIEQMLIRPDMSSKQVDVAAQVKAFTDKSGLNMENKIAAAPHELSAAAVGSLKDNLKSGLVRLTDEINRIDAYKLSQSFRESVVKMRDAASDTLTNLTALQLMNHKPAALEMMYTQLPLFADNKIFNGELQVWYRKGAPKENTSAAVPVNLVFVLNTSNLGAIRVNMTVFKNEVECTVKTGNEKAKQALTRMRNDFLDNLKGGDYSVKAFNVIVDSGEGQAMSEVSSGGYVELGRINLKA